MATVTERERIHILTVNDWGDMRSTTFSLGADSQQYMGQLNVSI